MFVPPKKTSISRKPFATVVQEWSATVEMPKINKSFQSTESELKETTVEPIPLNELIMEMDELKTPQDKILFAVKNGDDNSTCELLKRLAMDCSHVNLNKIVDRQNSNCSLLHLAAQKNKVKSLELLSEKITNLDATDSISSTPLLHAVAHNCEDTAAFLLSKGTVNINAKDIYNKYPLLMALRNKNFKIAELLASNRGLDVHVRGTKGNTVLHTMVEEGDIRSVQFLVERCNASPQRRNNEEESALFPALPHIDIAQYLAHKFSKKGLAKMLVNANMYGKNLMHKTAADGFFDSMLLILGSLALGELSSAQVNSLLNSTDKFGETPLILAVKNGRRDVVKFLCECAEVNVNDGDREGNTPLHHAASSKDQEIVAILTAAGATFKATNKQDENEKKSRGVGDCCRSLNTLLVLMLSIFSVICIAAIAAICISFFASDITKSANQIRKKSFIEVMSYVGTSLDEHGTIFTTAYGQVFEPAEVLNETRAMRMTYAVYRSNYGHSTIMYSSYIKLADGRTVGVYFSGNATNPASTVYDSYEDSRYLLTRAMPDPRDYTWDQVFSIPYRNVSAGKLDYTWIDYNEKVNSTFWTPPYLKPLLTSFFISLMAPLRDPITNEYLGFFGLDATTDSLSRFIRDKAIEDKSTIVILEKASGKLLAVSDPRVPVFTGNFSTLVRYDGTEGASQHVTRMIKYARSRYGGPRLDKVGSKHIYDAFNMGGARQAINIGRVQDQFGIDWIVLQSLPMSTFFRSFYVSLGVMFGVTAFLLILSVVVSFLAARLFMAPIMSLIVQAEDIKMLQLEKVEKSLASLSLFTEVRSLQESFISMTARLKQFRAFIPSHILTVIEAEVSADFSTDNIKQELKEQHGIGTSSSSRSDTRGTSVSSNYNGKGMVSRALKSKLSSGSATVMTIQYPDLADILELYSSDDISETTKDLVEATREVIRDSNGQLVSMTSRKVVIVWNALIAQSDHRVRACRAASSCVSHLNKLHQAWTQKNLPILHLTIGISSGTLYYGNIGSDSTKFFTVIGKPAKLSNKLCSNNAQWGTQVIVSDDVYEAAREEFYMRPIERIEDVLMYELGDAKSQEDWVNELTHGNTRVSANDKWMLYQEGYELMQRDMFVDALTKFTAYLDKYPFDIVAQRMVEQCNDNMSTLSTRSEADLATL